MNAKKLSILAAILLVIVFVLIIGNRMSDTGANSATIFPSFNSAKCSAIIITKNNKTVKLKKENGVWVISEGKSSNNPLIDSTTDKSTENMVLADSSAVRKILDHIQNLKKDELISQNPKKQSIFEVDSANGILVEFFDNNGNSSGKFKIGKNGADWNSNYLRLIGSNDVYVVRPNIKNSFFTDKKRWRDKSIVNIDFASVQKFNLTVKDTNTNKENSITVERSTDDKNNVTWNITSPKHQKAENIKIENFIRSVNNIRTNDWDSDINDTTKLSQPSYKLLVKMENGDSISIVAGSNKKSSGNIYVKVSGKNELFLIRKNSLSVLNKNIDDFKEIIKKDDNDKNNDSKAVKDSSKS